MRLSGFASELTEIFRGTVTLTAHSSPELTDDDGDDEVGFDDDDEASLVNDAGLALGTIIDADVSDRPDDLVDWRLSLFEKVDLRRRDDVFVRLRGSTAFIVVAVLNTVERRGENLDANFDLDDVICETRALDVLKPTLISVPRDKADEVCNRLAVVGAVGAVDEFRVVIAVGSRTEDCVVDRLATNVEAVRSVSFWVEVKTGRNVEVADVVANWMIGGDVAGDGV